VERESLDPTRLVWLGLVVLASFGLGVVLLGPPEAPEEEVATPGPSPETASLQCLDGMVFRSIDQLGGQPTADGFPSRGYWTVTFKDGGYVLDQSGVHEAGRYRCDGATLLASSPLASHRGQIDAAGGRIAWDGQGFERTEGGAPAQPDAPKTVTTSG
jgi:hypothetical protein